jgi:LacI family transcriptional regulator
LNRFSGFRSSGIACRHAIVTEQTRLKVEAAIAELGFIRNNAARMLAGRRTDTVGVVLTNNGNSLFVDIARGPSRPPGRLI